MTPNERDRLISRYLDGTASDEEHHQLDGVICENPEVGREIIRMAAQEVMIMSALEENLAAEAMAGIRSCHFEGPINAARQHPRWSARFARPVGERSRDSVIYYAVL